MNKQSITVGIIAAVVAFGAGWAVKTAMTPPVIKDPATGEALSTLPAPQGGHDAHAVAAAVSATSGVTPGVVGPMGGGMLAGVDLSNPAAVDMAFVAGMLPHHEAAVADARLVIEHGESPEVKGLAQNIVTSQQSEIDWMRGWMRQHGARKSIDATATVSGSMAPLSEPGTDDGNDAD